MSTIDTIGCGSIPDRGQREAGRRFGFSRLVQLLSRWGEKRLTRRALLTLNDDQLKDIGISRADAYREGTTSFWR